MGRTKLLGAGLALAALLAASAAFPAGSGLRPLRLVGPAKEPGPMLAFVRHHGAEWLARVDGASLRLQGRPGVKLGFGGAWSYSPGGTALAVAARTFENDPDSLRFVDPQEVRAFGRAVRLDGSVQFLAWTAADIVVAVVSGCCPDESTIFRIDPNARRVVSRERLVGSILQGARTPGAVVLLLGPAGGIGPTRLVVVDGAGSRSVPLDVVGGRRWDESTNPPLGTQRIPALALDEEHGHAFVVTAEGRVADVDLGTLGVAYHELSRPASLVARVGAWLVPPAAAKGMQGPERAARWLGDGQLALTGSDWSASIPSPGTERVSVRPAGLEIVDTKNWSVHRLDAGASAVTVADGLLLATGATWTSEDDGHPADGIGLTAYGPDGAKRFQLFPGGQAWLAQTYAGRAYVGLSDERRLRVVDVASGTVTGERNAQLPLLLLVGAGGF